MCIPHQIHMKITPKLLKSMGLILSCSVLMGINSSQVFAEGVEIIYIGESSNNDVNKPKDQETPGDSVKPIEPETPSNPEKPVEPVKPEPKPNEGIGWQTDTLTKKKFYLNNKGERQKGWFLDETTNNWFYFDQDGFMLTGWLNDKYYNGWYHFNEDGKMTKGWHKSEQYKGWFYFDKGGKMATGWLKEGQTYYFLSGGGKMVTGWHYDKDGKYYYLKSSGAMVTGWFYDYTYNSYFFLTDSGAMAIGWAYDNNERKWYHFNSNGTWDKNALAFANWYVTNGKFSNNSGSHTANVGSDYIIISVDNQRLWLVRNNKVVVNVGVVTGRPASGFGVTPRGNYSVLRKETPSVLVGADYRLKVNYWMPFIRNEYGIHDAPWNPNYSSFTNPNYYLWGGSHGCVNIHSSDMPSIFNNSYVGIPVIVY